mmetsp:Transcript_1975/g.4892  ORF Transcript_1975/g.4892 Transcript_1975/m.4892 type:complete len:758 (+) Transcript_1975:3534-5807(+)
MHNIERSSIINQQNTIAQAINRIVPFLPEDAVGILVCKPILRSIIPAHLSGNGKSDQVPKSSKSTSYGLLKDLTMLLQSCLCHLDPKSIVKYYFCSNSGSISQLLSKSFEATPELGAKIGGNQMKDASTLSQYDSSEELLKEAGILVCDIIGRMDACHCNEVFPIVEGFCSQVNDSYLSIALHQSVTGQGNPYGTDGLMLLPGIDAAQMISNKIAKMCRRDILELHCPSSLEFQAWLNQARGLKNSQRMPLPEPFVDPLAEEQRQIFSNDELHEIVGGNGFEMRASRRPTNSHSSVLRDITLHTSTSDGSMRKGVDEGVKTKSRRDLAWVLGLHKVERKESFRYLWQPRMMLSTVLKDENSLLSENGDHEADAVTSMAANQPESMLIAGNDRGEILLFDLKCHPPVLKQKKQFDDDGSIMGDAHPIRQVDFFDRDGTVLVCNGGLHLYNTATETILSSLLPENTFQRNWADVHKKWKGDNFIGFSLFPNASGLGEMLGDAIREFATISSSHLYIINVRCGISAVKCHNMLWPEGAHPKKSKFDPMVRALTWNLSSPQEEREKNTKAFHDRIGKTRFELTCITTHVDWICTGSSSGHIHCFDRRGRLLSCWKGHTKSVEYLKAISRHRLVSVSGDKTAVLWDMTKTQPQKISSIYNIPGKECSINVTSHRFSDEDSIVSIPGDSDLLLCAAAGRKAVFMSMPQESHHPMDIPASRIVMSDFEGNQITSSGKSNIRSILLLPCRQLVLLGCGGKIQVCL